MLRLCHFLHQHGGIFFRLLLFFPFLSQAPVPQEVQEVTAILGNSNAVTAPSCEGEHGFFYIFF